MTGLPAHQQNGTLYMNKLDHSIQIKIIKDGKEKLFYLPPVCEDRVWSQLFEDVTDHTVEIWPWHITIAS